MRVLLMHGPNLNLLGSREPGIYGALTLADIEAALAKEAAAFGLSFDCFQSNYEERMAERLRKATAENGVMGVILNAGAYTHTGEALAEAVRRCGVPVVEVHLSNVFAREAFRHVSLLTSVCRGVICGLGYDGYRQALHALVWNENANS